MDHTKILKRAWHILWSYKVLWIFGIILAITTASGGGGGTSYSLGSGGFQDRQFRDITPDDFRREFDDGLEDFGRELENAFEDFEDFFGEGIRNSTVDTIIAIGIALLIFFLILFIVGRIARYVSETALIKMVDQYEETEERLTIRKGFRLGWSRTAWRLFLINNRLILRLGSRGDCCQCGAQFVETFLLESLCDRGSRGDRIDSPRILGRERQFEGCCIDVAHHAWHQHWVVHRDDPGRFTGRAFSPLSWRGGILHFRRPGKPACKRRDSVGRRRRARFTTFRAVFLGAFRIC